MKKLLLGFFLVANAAINASTPSLNPLELPDSVSIDSSRHSLLPLSPADTLREERADSSSSPVAWRAGVKQTGPQIAQDALQLVESVLPVLPLHSGEVGVPSFLGAGGLPPRLVDIHVNGVRWMPSVFGLVDATGVPEILAEEISRRHHAAAFPSSMSRSALGFSFAPENADNRVPLSSINFVRGPFGGDAIRAWISRRLSSRMDVLFSLDEANSSGQFSNLPYDGQKLSAALGYRLSPRSALRYQYFNSENEAGTILSFYPEGQQGDGSGISKEQRLYHGVEFSTPAFFLRPFYWRLRNEVRGATLSVRHRTEEFGVVAGWQVWRERWLAKLIAEFEDDRITSTSVSVPPSQNYRVRGEFDWSPANNFHTLLAAALHKEADWPAAFDVDWGLTIPIKKNLTAQADLQRRIINPAPAEFANALAVLQSNPGLEPSELRRGALGIHWQPAAQHVLQIQFAVNHLIEPFVLDTLTLAMSAQLVNSFSQNVPSLDFMAQWQLHKNFSVGAHGAWMMKEAPELFWYQHVRRGYARGFVELLHDFFGGDLATRLRFVARHYGQSFAPIYSATALPAYVNVPGGTLLDVQLFLRHGDGVLYFSFENILSKKIEWLPGVSAPGYFLKWGVRWDFRN